MALMDCLGRNVSEHYCTWSEISCNEPGSVISIELDSNFGSGPYDLGNLDFSSFSNLARLIIRGWLLEGRIPKQIGMLSNLAHLSLRGNYLNGTLPVSLTNLTKLVVLDLYENNFTSTIPSQIGNLKNLLHLDLSQNQFSGLIPSSLGSMVNLTYLDLTLNNFIGSIPSSLELSNLQKLMVLNLADNDLGGSIPLNITNLKYLEHIDLSKNRMTGVVITLKGCPKLHYLDLSSNNFVGEALTYGDFLFNLWFLNQSENHLTTTVPTDPPNTALSNRLFHHLIIILPVIVGICFLLLGWVLLAHRSQGYKDQFELANFKTWRCVAFDIEIMTGTICV
ncbi:MDIS1-interacting receptor like kinase 2-like protein [Tanacetum coccineum]|uniref:MDIS1-interacting receptor like kinase 2-like protein n=1 Tax=Tanacetum coccineum TaxID=301880 RepID=A0ABQ4WQ24_9ASTR